jgi:hypothetical protein
MLKCVTTSFTPIDSVGLFAHRHRIFERDEEILSEIDGQEVNRCVDDGHDIRVHEIGGHRESLTEDIQ